jgi:putrescine transport system substrate-binding protein
MLSVLLVLAGCGGSAPGPAPATTAAPAAEEPVLNVYNWSDYVAENTIANFEKETGIKVVYDVYDSNEILEAKLIAGSSGYDVVFPSARPFGERQVKAKLYAALDKAQLPNWKNLDPAVLAAQQDADPGNAHLMPYMWGSTGLGYNVKLVRERLGDVPVDSWSVLFDPANAAKLADCGISILDDEQEGYAAALIWQGKVPNDEGPQQTEAVTKAYAGIAPHIRYFNSSKYIDDLANGEVCLAMGYSGDVLQARDRAEEAANGIEVAFAIPKEGALRAIDNAAIPADAPHPRNAHRFLDYLMRPDVAAAITNYVGYPNANAAATPLVEESIRTDPAVYPPADVAAKLIEARSVSEAEQRERVRAWTRIKTGQ